MSISSYDATFGVLTGQFAVPAGATNAILVQGVATQHQINLKYFSGGTCEILGATFGQTLAAADLATLSGSGYLFSALEKVSLNGPARFYLSSTGATSIVMFTRELTQDAGVVAL